MILKHFSRRTWPHKQNPPSLWTTPRVLITWIGSIKWGHTYITDHALDLRNWGSSFLWSRWQLSRPGHWPSAGKVKETEKRNTSEMCVRPLPTIYTPKSLIEVWTGTLSLNEKHQKFFNFFKKKVLFDITDGLRSKKFKDRWNLVVQQVGKVLVLFWKK